MSCVIFPKKCQSQEIDKAKADMTTIASVINSLEVPAFTLKVNTANYRHKGGKTIKTWHLR